MDTAEALRLLTGAPDLYAVFRRIGARMESAALPGLLAALTAGDAAQQATADRLASIDKALLAAILRKGAGLPALPNAVRLRDHLARVQTAPLFDPDPADATSIALLTNGDHPDMPAFSDRAFDAWFAGQGVTYGLGAYGEKRSVYASAQFADRASAERRMIHMGVDVFAPAMTPVFAPLAGVVHSIACNAGPLDYGHTLILSHEGDGLRFHSLYGHLAATLPGLLSAGQQVARGQIIAHLGDWPENGGWAAHLHVQVIGDMLDQAGNFFGVGHESLWDVWGDICPDPNLILRLPPGKFLA